MANLKVKRLDEGAFGDIDQVASIDNVMRQVAEMVAGAGGLRPRGVELRQLKDEAPCFLEIVGFARMRKPDMQSRRYGVGGGWR